MTTEAEDTRGYRRGRVKRAEILDAALAAFAEVGYLEASMRDIAAAVGLTQPGLLHHFPSKKALLSAVLEHSEELDAANLSLNWVSRGGRVPEVAELIEGMVRLVSLNQTRPALIELFATLSAEATWPAHPAHAYFVDRYERLLGETTAILTDYERGGRLRPGLRPADAARIIIAAMDGLQIQWLLERDAPERVDMAAVLRTTLESLLVGSVTETPTPA